MHGALGIYLYGPSCRDPICESEIFLMVCLSSEPDLVVEHLPDSCKFCWFQNILVVANRFLSNFIIYELYIWDLSYEIMTTGNLLNVTT